MNKENIKPLATSLAIPLLTGSVAGLISKKGIKNLAVLTQPPLNPPSWVFPVAWTGMYLLMGYSSYLVYKSFHTKDAKTVAYVAYLVQLAFNFCWMPIFFLWQMRLFALIWIIILWALVVACNIIFERLDRKAGYFFVPYSMWTTFAVYLTFGVYILNR